VGGRGSSTAYEVRSAKMRESRAGFKGRLAGLTASSREFVDHLDFGIAGTVTFHEFIII
jgi:hypothetical protein